MAVDGEENLKTLLLSNDDGRKILQYFTLNKGLANNVKNLLSRVIIAREQKRVLANVPEGEQLQVFRITKERFFYLANEIAKLFPGENPDVYYSPSKYVPGNNRNLSIPISGKLWDNFNYEKDQLRKYQFLSSRPVLTELNLQVNENDVEHLDWLKSHVAPWNEVLNKWKITFHARRKLLQVDNVEIHDYYKDFPSLELNDGQKLFDADFESLYPGRNSWFLDKWDGIKEVLIRELPKVTINNVEDKSLLTCISRLTKSY